MSYAFVEGAKGYIVTENDFCHHVRSLNENIELRAHMPWECEQNAALKPFQVFTLAQLREIATPITSYREWAHYWGIKHRVLDNYKDLLASMREIGADTSAMPEWGAEAVRPSKSATSDLEWDESIREAEARATSN